MRASHHLKSRIAWVVEFVQWLASFRSIREHQRPLVGEVEIKRRGRVAIVHRRVNAAPRQAGADVLKRIAAPMIGGVLTSAILELLLYPVIYMMWRQREVSRRTLSEQPMTGCFTV